MKRPNALITMEKILLDAAISKKSEKTAKNGQLKNLTMYVNNKRQD